MKHENTVILKNCLAQEFELSQCKASELQKINEESKKNQPTGGKYSVT